ncbi:hypothetical protein [Octadecabacter ascidiaceicola]|uniref:Ferrochelatase n=1 Tax=Octadecabacter ascidiaceicola TaxID=1655543 RepID=A0A238KGT9_9RHOB|nr:hypothetical protein [Octadecabacter ascidiaceicola]SMX41960.1 hypothetical protein OCA8868_02621 [Octadecabacter ascidiaceicola]
MKIKTLVAAGALATASTTSFAGNNDAVVITPAPDFVAPAATNSPSAKYIVPIVACLIICTALGSGGGS